MLKARGHSKYVKVLQKCELKWLNSFLKIMICYRTDFAQSFVYSRNLVVIHCFEMYLSFSVPQYYTLHLASTVRGTVRFTKSAQVRTWHALLPRGLHTLSQLGGLYLILNFETASGMKVTFGNGIDWTFSLKTSGCGANIVFVYK